MTKQEIFVLNRALDGEPIYGIPDFSGMGISELLIDEYKEKMIREGLLADKENLTVEGATMVSRMEDYKSSNTFVTLNNLTIGKNINGKMVSLMHNPFYDEYSFSRIKISEDCSNLLDAYSFLKNIPDSETVFVEKIAYNDLVAKYGQMKKDYLRITRCENGMESVFTIFTKDNKAYLYDEESETLSIVGKHEIMEIIREELQ